LRSSAIEELDAVALVEDNPFRDGWSLRKLLNGPDGTNVNFGVSAVLALGITAVFFVVIVWPLVLAGTKVGQLFGERDWVQYASTFLAVWAGVILSIKMHLLRRQRQSLRLPV
jgi:hypothetical protein